MSDVSKKDIEKEISKILKNANLAETSAKKVRQKLEKSFGVDLSDKRKLIDQLVMDYVNKKGDSDEDDEEEEVEEKPKKRAAAASKRPSKKSKKKATEEELEEKSGSDSDGAARSKGSGYTRSYKLSPALAELMGKEEMPRHEVVKRVWAIIKEKQLYDPNNRKFAICDDALYKVFGTKRFRAFGMMKYLKTHFLDE